MKRITAILAVTTLIISARGQGFLNLNFESATSLPGNPGTGNGALVSVANALPDWTAYAGPAIAGNALSDIYYVSNVLNGSSSAVQLEGGTLALSGNYSVELFGDSAIGQTAVVPDDAASLQFEAGGEAAGGSGALGASGLSVTLGGQALSLSIISEDPGYDVYGANIPSDLDDETEALIFSCQGVGAGQVLLDDIDFSTMSVPEPSECALIGFGAILFGLCRRRKPSIGGSPGRI